MVAEIPVKGFFEVNCYCYIDERTKHGFLIDPGAQARGLRNLIAQNGWTIEKILLTHGHFDHMGAVNELRDALSVPVYAYRTADDYLSDARNNLSALCGPPITVRDVRYLDDGDIVALAANPSFSLRVIYTPGHTTDSVVYYSERDAIAFAGDTIFKGSIGTDQYPGGSATNLRTSIVRRIFTLPPETVLFSGHTERTTVGTEKRRYRL
ncbi:MAG TPA: MBL fold metallo-hydrolase [Clostridiales bacterium]|nr:MBL fold metallo-hydrolase [Clostridiales bacterium]